MKADDLKSLAVKWLAETYPECVIIPELSIADWGAARVDVAAITEDRIVGVEIKGDGDSPTRLELQGLRYGQVCEHMWLLTTPEEKLANRCHAKRPKGWGGLEVSDGAVKRQVRCQSGDYISYRDPYDSPFLCAWSMCGTLWRDELYAICAEYGLSVQKASARARQGELTKAIIDQLPTPTIHRAMVQRLRERKWHPDQKARLVDTRSETAQEQTQQQAPLFTDGG